MVIVCMGVCKHYVCVMVFAAVTTPRKGNQIWLVCNPALTKELYHCSLIPRLRSGSLVPKLSPFLVGKAWNEATVIAGFTAEEHV